MANKTPPHPVDLHVGARLRLKRRLAGVSQIQLADALGLTFQQIQKYEKGTNRISASKLHEVALTLATPIAWFFENLDDRLAARSEADPATAPLPALIATAEGLELALRLARTPARLRSQVLALIRAFAETDDLAAPG